ncbi:hypothetical protein [Neisseria sicca]|uniref:hypothetical protein n=1 Tax=Neisseria sicca TaxID=490 RepID=UPI00031942C6|nr:hypothetical protein [Neisseria sicca]
MGFAHEKHQQKGRLKPKIRFQTTSETNPKRRLPPATAAIKNRPKPHPKCSDNHKSRSVGFAHEKHQPKGRLKPKIPFQTTIKAKAHTPKNQGPDYKEEKTIPSVRTPVQTAFPYSGIFRPTKPRAGTIC